MALKWLKPTKCLHFVRYNRVFVLTEFVITEFVKTEFDCIFEKELLYRLCMIFYKILSLLFCHHISWFIIHGRPQTFFQGRAKFSRGAKTYYLPKKHKNRYYFSQKSQKTYYFGRPGGGGGKCPLLPSPADAHGKYF